MIKPTIFIGLGTTGTDILKQLRQLMSEEFGYSGLPIFRYIAIETRHDETGNNLRHFKDYEQIHVVNATIESTNSVKRKLDPNYPDYNPHLTAWITPDLLNYIQSFMDGASHIRMAGRLCLWENWEGAWYAFGNAHSAVISQDNFHKTWQILEQNYRTKNLQVPPNLLDHLVDPTGINVYVVGTLCGGTCSGMFIDMAYLIRSILGSGGANEVNGIFTIFDRLSAEDNDVFTTIRAANCYASLSELNYYNHTETTYDVTFPNGLTVNTPQKPYDYELIVSPASRNPAIRFVSSDGRLDEQGLNLMVALNLFAETAGDTDGRKKEFRVEFGGYGGLQPVPAGEIPTMTRCLASFGLTAVWYPKYRIASAAACLASRMLCQKWMEIHTNLVSITEKAKQEWHQIFENANILSNCQVEGSSSLKQELESILNFATSGFEQMTSSDDLIREMNACPINQGFSSGGRYYEWMQSKVHECSKAFCDAIDKSFDNQINNIDLQGTYGTDDVRAFFYELDRVIEQALQQCPLHLPTLDLNVLDFDPMHRGEKNIWLKITGRQKRIVKVHQDRLIEEYRQLIIGNDGIYLNLRSYFLKEVLEAARAKLGFTVHADGPTIKEKLTHIEVNLNNCAHELREGYEFEIDPRRTYNYVKIITNNPENNIHTDAEALSNRIMDSIALEDLLIENGNVITMSTFLNKGQEDIKLQLIETYRRFALNRINQDGLLVEKIQELLDTDGGEIKNLAIRSNPYQEFTREYSPLNTDKIILGHDPSETNDGLNDLQNRLDFRRSINFIVDHFLFFYEEEAGFALDDLAAYNELKRQFERNESPYGHWTHQNPDFYDITLIEKRKKLERWCRALAQLVPEIQQKNEDAFKEVFQYQDETLFFQYVDEYGLVRRLGLTDDAPGIKVFCRQGNETNYNNFFNSVIDEFQKLEFNAVTQHVNHLIQQITDIDELGVLSDYYRQFLNEVYRNE